MPPDGPQQGDDDCGAPVAVLQRDVVSADCGCGWGSGVPRIAHLLQLHECILETRHPPHYQEGRKKKGFFLGALQLF